jgi:flagellar M-ring protein FliF
MPPQLPPVDEAKVAAEAKAAEETRLALEAKAAEEAAALQAEEEEEEEEEEEDEVEMEDGETLEELKARMNSMKPKKPTFSADMLDTANSYDDKVALIRMLVSQESGRVAMVLKNMVKN